MAVSRRSFVRTLGLGGAGLAAAPLLAARGHEALAADPSAAPLADAAGSAPPLIRLDSNENAHGPAPAALDAVRAALGDSCRYPFALTTDLRAAIARHHGIAAEQVILGVGSTETLRLAVAAFTAPGRHLVTAAPTFEEPGRHAERIGTPIRAVRVDGALRLDLAAMGREARGAGLVFVCNPNNPTGTVHGAAAIADLVRTVLRDSPGTRILIDEAYHEFVEDPRYATAIPLALAHPQVIVSRTFSKVHGLAGLRVGYAIAHPDAIKAMDRFKLNNSMTGLGAVAALATLPLSAHVARQRQLNRDARELTRRALADLGHRAADSEANFLMVDVRRDAKRFQEDCRALGVAVGRPFPPLATHARISIGTIDEMGKAVEVFRKVLRKV